ATVAAAFLTALISCSDSSGPTALSGTVSFTFTGGGGGTFSLTANAPGTGNAGPTPTVNTVAGAIDEAGGYALVIANKVHSGLQDLLIIAIGRTTVGTKAVDAACDPEGASCSGLIFFLNFNGSGDTFGQACEPTAGSFEITEVSTTRIKGTFTGTGTCTDANDVETAFTVTGGTFDVALSTGLL